METEIFLTQGVFSFAEYNKTRILKVYFKEAIWYHMHTESDQKFKIMVMLMELTCKKKIDLFINVVAILKSFVSNSYYNGCSG